MCISCATAGLLQAILSGIVQSLRNDKYINTNEIANAVIGGLVAITGCCPFVEPWEALIIGCKCSPACKLGSALIDTNVIMSIVYEFKSLSLQSSLSFSIVLVAQLNTY